MLCLRPAPERSLLLMLDRIPPRYSPNHAVAVVEEFTALCLRPLSLPQADLFLVLGTSLKVQPVSRILQFIPANVPQVSRTLHFLGSYLCLQYCLSVIAKNRILRASRGGYVLEVGSPESLMLRPPSHLPPRHSCLVSCKVIFKSRAGCARERIARISGSNLA